MSMADVNSSTEFSVHNAQGIMPNKVNLLKGMVMMPTTTSPPTTTPSTTEATTTTKAAVDVVKSRAMFVAMLAAVVACWLSLWETEHWVRQTQQGKWLFLRYLNPQFHQVVFVHPKTSCLFLLHILYYCKFFVVYFVVVSWSQQNHSNSSLVFKSPSFIFFSCLFVCLFVHLSI